MMCLRSIEESLQRLQTDHVEIVLVHDPDRAPHGERQAIDEGFPTLIELREQGVIKALGCGMNEWQMPAAFIRRFDIDAVLLAGRYTLLDHDAYDEFLPLCVERDVKIIVGGPYNSGILARDLSGYVTFNYERAPEHLVEHARKLDAVCRRHGVDLKAAALQFVLAHPAVANGDTRSAVGPGVGTELCARRAGDTSGRVVGDEGRRTDTVGCADALGVASDVWSEVCQSFGR